MNNDELDMTFVKMVQDKNKEMKEEEAKVVAEQVRNRLLEVMEKKSITPKKHVIFGELYKGKGITKGNITRACIVAGVALAAITTLKVASDINKSNEYKAVLNTKVENELSYNDAKEFTDTRDVSYIESMKALKEAEKSLDKGDYDKHGNRIDGTKSIYNHQDDLSITYTDKEYDAMELAANNEIEEFKKR